MMNDKQRMAVQLHLNSTFVIILDGRMAELVKQLAQDTTPQMRVEVTMLKSIYEKFLEAKPLIEQLQQQGRNIRNANAN